MAERSSALDSRSGGDRIWVRIPAWPVVMLMSTINHIIIQDTSDGTLNRRSCVLSYASYARKRAIIVGE